MAWGRGPRGRSLVVLGLALLPSFALFATTEGAGDDIGSGSGSGSGVALSSNVSAARSTPSAITATQTPHRQASPPAAATTSYNTSAVAATSPATATATATATSLATATATASPSIANVARATARKDGTAGLTQAAAPNTTAVAAVVGATTNNTTVVVEPTVRASAGRITATRTVAVAVPISNEQPAASGTQASNDDSTSDSSSTTTMIVIVVVLLLSLTAVCGVACNRRRARKTATLDEEMLTISGRAHESFEYSLHGVASASAGGEFVVCGVVVVVGAQACVWGWTINLAL